MALDFDVFAILLLLAPFPAALLAPLIARETGAAAGWILAIVPAGLFLMLGAMLPSVASGKPVLLALDWVPALDVRLGFAVDGLSLLFALVITGVGAIVLVYADAYFRDHPQRGRFLALMLAFIGAMLGLVLADGLVALFTFWELTAVISFLLIGFDHERPAARRAATQALIVTGLGGLSLMAGGVLLRLVTQTWDLSAMGGFAGALPFSPAYPWIVGFLVVTAFTKSAQLPFHFWLPRAMEAPTPVSAYLHAAAMVQAGIYLLARLSPLLSGTPLWQALLCGLGGATLLWGAVRALAQTDLKQLLAQTTVAALGLMVFLLGIGGPSAAMAVAAVFIAHALYKAGLFLLTGIIDKQTGTRDITALGGLRDHLTITFIAVALAGLSMLGVPPFMGWFGKELGYSGFATTGWSIGLLAILVIGNALLGASALALVIRPFMGPPKPGLDRARDPSFAFWIGPVLLGLAGFVVVFALTPFGDAMLAPAAAAIAGRPVSQHLELAANPLALAFWLSIASWALAGLVYWQLDSIREMLRLLEQRFSWSMDKGLDALLSGLIRLGAALSRLLQHGRLETYLATIVGILALSVLGALWRVSAWPALRSGALSGPSLPEWGTLVLAVVGIGMVVLARSRLAAIFALGVQGLALALIFLVLGAPDLSLTQLIVEVLTVAILALIMIRLDLAPLDRRPPLSVGRDAVIAVVAAGGVTLLLMRVLAAPFNARLSDFFEANSAALAHGRNIVNVILVDFRGLDTLGEITVVFAAAIAAVALLRPSRTIAPVPAAAADAPTPQEVAP